MLILLTPMAAAAKEPAAKPAVEPVPVTSALALKKDVPVEIKAIGNVEAVATVAIKSRVGGELRSVHFREGDAVARNALLFRIDPRPYEAALNHAGAVLERDRVLLRKAREDVKRYEMLAQKDYVAQEQYQKLIADAEALEAGVKVSEADAAIAALQLEYAAIESPIEGRAGALLVHAGNIIKSNDDKPMVVIHQIKPIYIRFAVPEIHLAEIRKQKAKAPLKVEATPDETMEGFEGELRFIDNEVDANTGTVVLKAVFPNADESLRPGQFARVTLVLNTLAGATVIPSQAIQAGQQGSYAFVIQADGTAQLRILKTGIRRDGETVITEGIAPGEEVVTDGQLRLVPGVIVNVVKKGLTVP